MKCSILCLLFIAALHGVLGVFVSSLLLPLGGIASTANGILGFKISMAASALSMLSKGFKGTFNLRAGTDIADSPSDELSGRSALMVPGMTTTTTEQTVVRVPISVLQDIFKLNNEQQQQANLLFAFLKEMDDRGCVSRMVCESAADALRLGQVGNATAHLFNTDVAVLAGPASVFVSAAKTGRSRGLAGCARAFPECTADLPHILGVAGLT
ncbi:uncharacterized protein LOC142574289 [Dermacentor variabilis]|uniref:uncharacterized protein LOC142574289 n=1 Tax=Dermacentor variabilis TaxID=34621 RepID=UPI003F5C070B